MVVNPETALVHWLVGGNPSPLDSLEPQSLQELGKVPSLLGTHTEEGLASPPPPTKQQGLVPVKYSPNSCSSFMALS